MAITGGLTDEQITQEDFEGILKEAGSKAKTEFDVKRTQAIMVHFEQSGSDVASQ